MNKKIKIVLLLALTFIFPGMMSSCTDNQLARNYGGKSQIILPKGQKLINATWKNDDLWFLTRPMKTEDQPETYLFKEDSSFGLMQGEVSIKETK